MKIATSKSNILYENALTRAGYELIYIDAKNPTDIADVDLYLCSSFMDYGHWLKKLEYSDRALGREIPFAVIDYTNPYPLWNRYADLMPIQNNKRVKAIIFVAADQPIRWGFCNTFKFIPVGIHPDQLPKKNPTSVAYTTCMDPSENRKWYTGADVLKQIDNVSKWGDMTFTHVDESSLDNIKNACLYLHTSYHDPIPAGLIYAMLMGMPIVGVHTHLIHTLLGEDLYDLEYSLFCDIGFKLYKRIENCIDSKFFESYDESKDKEIIQLSAQKYFNFDMFKMKWDRLLGEIV